MGENLKVQLVNHGYIPVVVNNGYILVHGGYVLVNNGLFRLIVVIFWSLVVIASKKELCSN